MNSPLIEPIKERIRLGHAKMEIEKEVIQNGYSAEEFEEAYAACTKWSFGAWKWFIRARWVAFFAFILCAFGALWERELAEWALTPLGITLGSSVLSIFLIFLRAPKTSLILKGVLLEIGVLIAVAFSLACVYMLVPSFSGEGVGLVIAGLYLFVIIALPTVILFGAIIRWLVDLVRSRR